MGAQPTACTPKALIRAKHAADGAVLAKCRCPAAPPATGSGGRRRRLQRVGFHGRTSTASLSSDLSPMGKTCRRDQILEAKGLALAGLPRPRTGPAASPPSAVPAPCRRPRKGCGVWHERLLVCGKQVPARWVPASGRSMPESVCACTQASRRQRTPRAWLPGAPAAWCGVATGAKPLLQQFLLLLW